MTSQSGSVYGYEWIGWEAVCSQSLHAEPAQVADDEGVTRVEMSFLASRAISVPEQVQVCGLLKLQATRMA
jgi:hypothetical protein